MARGKDLAFFIRILVAISVPVYSKPESGSVFPPECGG